MRAFVERGMMRRKGVRKPGVAVVALVAAFAVFGGPAPAVAGVQQDFTAFRDCPVNAPGVTACLVSTVTSGEFTIGSKTVAINKPVILQGGYNSVTHELVPALDGNTLSKTALTVPGGLVGIEGLGGEVTATAELAGTVSINLETLGTGKGTAVTLPVKVKLSNPALGEACYIGSNSEPVTITLTTGTTSPPAPNKPITGKLGTIGFKDGRKIATIESNSLVGNEFPAPGVNGCGGVLAPVIDPIVDVDAGLPAAAGHNTAVLNGNLESASAAAVKVQSELPEVGRCTKVEAIKEGKEKLFKGGFFDAGCIEESAAKEGKYEWAPGPGPSNKFTGKGTAATLETVGKAIVKCSGSTATGEYTGAKTATATVTFVGCTLAATKGSCHSSGAGTGEIVTSALEGELGFIKEEYKEESELLVSVGLDLKHAPSIATAECVGGKEAVVVEGSVIAPVTVLDKMAASSTLKYAQAAGVQTPEQFEVGAKDTLVASLGAGPQQAGLATTEKLAYGEKLEIKAEGE
jgi:hypothetical protein